MYVCTNMNKYAFVYLHEHVCLYIYQHVYIYILLRLKRTIDDRGFDHDMTHSHV